MEASRAASHVEFFAKACTAILEVVENGRYRVKNYRERLQSIPYLDITLGTSKNATFLLRGASITFIFHRLRGLLHFCAHRRGVVTVKPDFIG
jgi:hypothetical protein